MHNNYYFDVLIETSVGVQLEMYAGILLVVNKVIQTFSLMYWPIATLSSHGPQYDNVQITPNFISPLRRDWWVKNNSWRVNSDNLQGRIQDLKKRVSKKGGCAIEQLIQLFGPTVSLMSS